MSVVLRLDVPLKNMKAEAGHGEAWSCDRGSAAQDIVEACFLQKRLAVREKARATGKQPEGYPLDL